MSNIRFPCLSLSKGASSRREAMRRSFSLLVYHLFLFLSFYQGLGISQTKRELIQRLLAELGDEEAGCSCSSQKEERDLRAGFNLLVQNDSSPLNNEVG